jgi:SAM-dependent methyltransferase
MDTVQVAPSNADQLRDWDGSGGAFWAANAARFDAGVAAHHGPFIAAAAIRRSDRVLDVGCGAGQASRDAARAASEGSVLGVDLSSKMLEVARRLATAEGVTNACFEQADAQAYPFAAESFDAAISRHGTMFFGDPVAAFANIGRALRPGGRLVLLTWQPAVANEWIREIATALAAGRQPPTPPPTAPGPFALSDPDRVRGLLGEAGFRDVRLEPHPAPMYWGATAGEAERFALGVAGWMMDGLDEASRGRAIGDLRASLAAHETARGVVYDSATWIVTARRP